MKILKEDLEMLKEDLGIFAVPVTLLVMSALGYLADLAGDGHPGVPGRKDRPLPNRNVISAINAMWDDKVFIKDFAKILSDEGDIDKLAALIKSFNKPAKEKIDWSKNGLHVKEKIWKQINSTNFEPHPTAKRIVQRLLQTSSYKGIVKRFKLTKEDEQYFAKLILFTIMRDEFTQYAKEYILKTVKPLPFLSRIGRNINPADLSFPQYR